MNGYVGNAIEFIVNFTSTKAGLATVGYQLKSGGVDFGGRIMADIFENGGGSYGVVLTFVEPFSGVIVWDTGDTDIKYAREDVNIITNLLIIPEYVGPVVVIPAPPTPNLQRLSGNIKTLGVGYATGDTVTLTPTGTQVVNGSVLSNLPLIPTVDIDGTLLDPEDGLPGVLVDKGASVFMECKRGINPVYTYSTKPMIITNDDTKDVSTYP